MSLSRLFANDKVPINTIFTAFVVVVDVVVVVEVVVRTRSPLG